ALTCATVPGSSRTNAGFASRPGLVRSDSQAMAKASPHSVSARTQRPGFSIITVVSSLLAQPFVQHDEVVQPLAVIPRTLTVLTSHVANPSGVEPAAVPQALAVRQLIGPGARCLVREPHRQRNGEAVRQRTADGVDRARGQERMGDWKSTHLN